MPNDCYCDVRIGANEEHIQMFVDTEFSFEKLRPRPEGVDWYEWNCANWGTKWDRYEFKLRQVGDEGMIMTFDTAWVPPCELFKYLAETYHDVWIRCDWEEEGGYAGVYVVHWNQEKNKLEESSASWMDWCIEEKHYRLTKSNKPLTPTPVEMDEELVNQGLYVEVPQEKQEPLKEYEEEIPEEKTETSVPTTSAVDGNLIRAVHQEYEHVKQMRERLNFHP